MEADGFIFPPLSDDGEIVQVFEELPVLSNGKYDRRLSPPFIQEELLLGRPHC
jgi:hypothetical protein